MIEQDQLDHTSHANHPFPRLASVPATLLAALVIMMGTTVKGAPGDKWILPINHVDGSGYTIGYGEGYDGGDTYEYDNFGSPAPVVRVYWALDGLSVGTSNAVPTTTEQYTIEWWQPVTTGGVDWQPIESQFRGVDGEVWPIEPKIPWAGTLGQNHQWIGAEGIAGTPGTWTTTGPGPHTPNGTNYTAGDNGIYMWLTRGSWLYAKWDFGFRIDHTWSALRLTQVTETPIRPVIQSVSQSNNTITLTWSALANKTYQVQYKTNLAQTNWINLGGTTPGASPTATALDVNPPEPSRFYRVQVQ